MTLAPPLLEIEDLHLHELGGPAQGRTVHAVDGISLALAERGRALGVVGESGLGKTSLATALMRTKPK